MAQNAQIFDALLTSQRASGVTLSGGKVYFYSPGTTNLKTIYTDRGKQTVASNPFTLDSNGQARVFGDGLYDVQVKNAALSVSLPLWEDVQIKDYTGEVAYSVADYASLEAAVAAIGSTRATLEYATDQTVSNDLTIPATLELRPLNEAKITVASTKTLTINGPFSAGLYQVFAGAGSVAGLTKVYPEWWGTGTDVTNAEAIGKAVGSLTAGGTLSLQGITYNVDSATLAGLTNAGWTLPASGITIEGAGDSTKIVVTGTTECALFYGANLSNITVKNIWFYGNSVATGLSANYVKGSAVSLAYPTLAAGADNILVENCRFDNFASAYWVTVNNTSGFPVKNVRYENNRYYSYDGNTQDVGGAGNPANFMNVSGNSADANGTVEDVWITGNYGEGSWIKGAASVWVNGKNFHIEKNDFINVGLSLANGAGNPYAIYSYVLGATSAVSDVFISNNRITSPYSLGIYSQGVNNMSIQNNIISGQVDTDDSTLPRAAIGINAGFGVVISNNELTDNVKGISVISVDGDMNHVITGNKITSTTVGNSFAAITIKSAGNGRGLVISSNNIQGTGRGILGSGNTTLGFKDVLIVDNYFNNLTDNINFSPVSGDLNCGFITIRGNYFKSVGTANVFIGSSLLGNFVISDNDFVGQVTGNQLSLGSLFLDIPDNTIINNRFKGQQTAGFCLYTARVRGNMYGNTFTDILETRQVATSAQEDLGYDAPTWTGKRGNYVQQINVTEAGTAASKYVIHGYVYDTTGTPGWRQDRRLTGN